MSLRRTEFGEPLVVRQERAGSGSGSARVSVPAALPGNAAHDGQAAYHKAAHRWLLCSRAAAGSPPQMFLMRMAYDVTFSRVVEALLAECCGALGVDGHSAVWYALVADMQGGINDAYICTQVVAVKAFPAPVNNRPYVVCCNNPWLPEWIMLTESRPPQGYALPTCTPQQLEHGAGRISLAAAFLSLHFDWAFRCISLIV
ncbi:hypothetical protein C8R43DRAFT_1123011 [Mycena crocata]|nr:hypothetical protein C8R43DRAFT_1123011 [Mycena crocata]